MIVPLTGRAYRGSKPKIKKLQVCKYARAVMPERRELATVIYYRQQFTELHKTNTVYKYGRDSCTTVHDTEDGTSNSFFNRC